MLNLEAFQAILYAAKCNTVNDKSVLSDSSSHTLSSSTSISSDSIANKSALSYIGKASQCTDKISPCTVCHIYFKDRTEQREHYKSAEHVLALKKKYNWDNNYLVDKNGKLIDANSEKAKKQVHESRFQDFAFRKSNVFANINITKENKEDVEHYSTELCYGNDIGSSSAFKEYDPEEAERLAKPFVCSICESRFSSEAGLEKHFKSKKHLKLTIRFEDQLKRDEEERKQKNIPDNSIIINFATDELSASLMDIGDGSNYGFLDKNSKNESEEEEEAEANSTNLISDFEKDDFDMFVSAKCTSNKEPIDQQSSVILGQQTEIPKATEMFITPNKFTVKNKHMLTIAEKKKTQPTISSVYDVYPKEDQIHYLCDKLETMDDPTLYKTYCFLKSLLSEYRNKLVQSEIEFIESKMFDCICYYCGDSDENIFKATVYSDIISQRPDLDQNTCVFCNEVLNKEHPETNITISEKLLHWVKCSNFVIRFAEALDPEKIPACIQFIESIISKYYQCLQCNKTFKSRQHVCDHIKSTGHVHMPLIPAMVDQFYVKEKLDLMLHDMHDMMVREMARKEAQPEILNHKNMNKVILETKKKESAAVIPKLSPKELDAFLKLRRSEDITTNKAEMILSNKSTDFSKMLTGSKDSNKANETNENEKQETEQDNQVVRIPKESYTNLPAWYRREMSSAVWCYESQKIINKITIGKKY